MKLRDNIPENYKDLSTRPLPGNCDWLVDKVPWHFLANHKELSLRRLSRNCDWLVDKSAVILFSQSQRVVDETASEKLRLIGWYSGATFSSQWQRLVDETASEQLGSWQSGVIFLHNLQCHRNRSKAKNKPRTFNKYVSAWASCSCVKGAISNLAGGGFVCAGGVITVIFAEFWKAKGDIRGAPAIAFGSCDGFWGVSYQVKSTRWRGTNPNTPYSKMAANKLFFCLHVN